MLRPMLRSIPARPMFFPICLLTVLLAVAAVVPGTAAAADGPAAGVAKEKAGPDEGQFEIAITTAGETDTFDTPHKATAALRRAVSLQRRAREGEEPDFSAVITLNGTKYEFTDAADAQAACQAVTLATRQLAAIRMGLGDIGMIPKFDPELAAEKLEENMKPTPAQAMMIVRQRIMLALQQEMRPAIGTSGRPSIPNPVQIQQKMNQITQREIKKAQDEGLLPSGPVAVQGDPVENHKESVVQMLAVAFSKAEPADADATKDQPDAPAKEEATEEAKDE